MFRIIIQPKQAKVSNALFNPSIPLLYATYRPSLAIYRVKVPNNLIAPNVPKKNGISPNVTFWLDPFPLRLPCQPLRFRPDRRQ